MRLGNKLLLCVQNKELEESFIRNPLFAEDHKVPGIQVAEIRIEHQSKKMVGIRNQLMAVVIRNFFFPFRRSIRVLVKV